MGCFKKMLASFSNKLKRRHKQNLDDELSHYPRTCTLHQTKMNVGEALISSFGKVIYTREYRLDRQEKFPNSNIFKARGMLIDGEDNDTVIVMYCTDCRLAERKWLETRGLQTPPLQDDSI